MYSHEWIHHILTYQYYTQLIYLPRSMKFRMCETKTYRQRIVFQKKSRSPLWRLVCHAACEWLMTSIFFFELRNYRRSKYQHITFSLKHNWVIKSIFFCSDAWSYWGFVGSNQICFEWSRLNLVIVFEQLDYVVSNQRSIEVFHIVSCENCQKLSTWHRLRLFY